MPGVDPILSGLAGLLALPANWNQARQGEMQQQTLLKMMLGQVGQGAQGGPPGAGPQAPPQGPMGNITPEMLNSLAPVRSPFPGSNVPVLGGLERGVGAVGQALQILTGSAPAAPRPAGEVITKMLSIQQRNEDRKRAQEHRDFMEKHTLFQEEEAKKRDEQGEQYRNLNYYQRERFHADAAARAGGAGGEAPSEFRLWQRQHPGAPVEDFEKMKTGAATDRAAQNAKVKQIAITSTTKSMVEAAPKVLHFIDKIEEDLKHVETGPAASRYNEFMTGRFGAPDPQWARYRTNVGLLATLLMRMHVGARGGVQIMEHFQNLLSEGTQSAANMRAALEAVRDYAQDVAKTGQPQPEGGAAPTGEAPSGPTEGTTPGGNTFRIVP